MKKTTRNIRGPGAWMLGGLATLMMCVPAFGQYTATQSAPITINDNATATPYPSTIDLTKSNLLGVVETVTVTVNGLTIPYTPDLGFLLVGPNNNAVVLMSGSGGNPSGSAALVNANLTFSDSASSSLPVASPLVSGNSYKPTDNANLSFPPSAPSTGYAATLTGAFTNSNPNGKWSLFVVDTTAGPPTSLSPGIASWTLNLQTTPTLVVVTNSSTVANGPALTTKVDENGSVTVNLIVNDSSTPVGGLTVGATKITSLVTNFSTGGTDQNRTLTITPNLNTFGTNSLTISVSDGVVSVSTNVNLEVKYVNQPPTISLSPSSVTTVAGLMNTNLVVAIVNDPDTAFNPVDSLHITATSSDPSVVAAAGVFSDFYTNGASRRIAIVPAGAATGNATLTISVDDGALTNSQTLAVTVNPVSNPLYANSNSISITAGPTGSGSSSFTIPANTVPGLIGRVAVAVNGWSGVVPASTTITLTAPGGQVINLLQNSGPSSPINYGQIVFADGGAANLPAAQNVTNTVFVAPDSPLSALVGGSPNGTWTLSVQNAANSAARILDGFAVSIFAAPTISTIANVFNTEESTTVRTFTVASVNGNVTNVTASIPGNPGLAKLTTALTGNNATLTIVGNFNQPGTNTVFVVAQDNNGFRATNSFTLGLSFLNHAPQIGFIPRQVTRVGEVLGPFPFSVQDVDTITNTISQVTVRASSDNQKLVPDVNIQIEVTGIDVQTATLTGTMTIYPIGLVSGTANITLFANDTAATSSSTFQVFADIPGVPLFGNANPLTINANGPGAPYPSVTTVSGLIGNVEKVSVTLFSLTAQSPANSRFLLVDPNTNHAVMLMAGAGGNNQLTVAAPPTLVFDDAATALVTQNGTIVSGTYDPSSYGTIANLPSPAPAGPYGSLLGAFTNINPNGDWKLYVADVGSAKGGSLLGGWQISIQTSPSIPPIKDQFTDENVTGKVDVIVGDNQPGVNLVVTATGDPTLFQPITVSGSGSTRTLTIPPQPYKFGTNVITVTSTDPSGRSAVQTFNMGVRAVAQPPLFVSKPADQTVPAAMQLGPIPFQVWPPQGGSLSVTASSPDNPTLVPSVEITSAGSVNGTNTYNLTLIPAGVLTGTATITIVASDSSGTGLKSTASFKLTVTENIAYANTSQILIPPGPITPGNLVQGEAVPYPSVVNIKGLGGVVSSVQVALVGFSHQHPEDTDILLVAPDGTTAVMLMAHAGQGSGASNLRLTFNDTAPSAIPQTGALASQAYKPANYAGNLTLPSPAPVSPYSTSLSAFAGLSPNGDWKLYVLDDTYPTDGSIGQGWILYIQTAPAIATIANQVTPENVPIAVPLVLSDASTDPTNLVVSVATSGNTPPNLVVPANISVTGSGANRTLNITNTLNLPSAYNILNGLTNRPGTNLTTVTVTDPLKNLTTQTSFGYTVLYVNQTPTVTTATNTVYVNENGQVATSKDISYTVGDVDSTTYLSNIVVTSSDQSLVANSNIVASIGGNTSGSASIAPGATAAVNVHIVPTKNASGTNQISFVVSDLTTSATNIVTLGVKKVWQQPTISSIPAQQVTAGLPTTNIQFKVGSVEVSSKDLVVWATSDNASVVPNTSANITFGGAADARTIQLYTLAPSPLPATANITVFVADASGQPNSTNSTVFALTAVIGAGQVFANISPITVSGANKANLYPSQITVAGLVGATYQVSAILPVFTHNAPADLDVLLVERGNDNKTNAVMLMSGAGGTSAVNGLRLTFEDSGNTLPTGSLASGIYRPANYNPGLVMPAPAPTNTLWKPTFTAAFQGLNPNGTWELYVNNRVSGDSGTIAAGWQLLIQTGPTLTGAPASVSLPENTTTTVNFTIGDSSTDVSNLVVSVSSDNTVLLPPRNVTFAFGTPQNQGHNQNVTATITPISLQSGKAKLIFTVSRADGASASGTTDVTVTSVNVPPTVSRLDPVTMPENTTTNIQFTVTDPDTALSSLVILATSDNGTLIASTNCTFFQSGTNRLFGLPSNTGTPETSLVTLNLKPNSFQFATNNITITITDPQPIGTNTVTSSFQLRVTPVVYAPFFVTKPASESVAAGGTVTEPFAVASPTAAATTLQVTGKSDNQAFIKDANITTALAPGDTSGTNRIVTVTAEQNVPPGGGSANVTLTAKDPANNATSTATFAVTVRPPRVVGFTNAAPITILDVSPANPYPSQITVAGLAGPIQKVTAMLQGFTHTFPSDVGVLMVGPTGQKIVLMDNAGNAGGGVVASNLFLTFDQSAANAIPQNAALTNGVYRPADYSVPGQRVFASPAPPAPYTNSLGGFTNTNPNGTWSLYVQDFQSGDVGRISNGWSIAITTLPVIQGLTDISVPENTNAVQNFTVADDTRSTPVFSFTASSDNPLVVTNAGIVVTPNPGNNVTNFTVTVSPVQNAFGPAKITLTMVNGDGQTVVTSFKATFTQVFYPPTIAPIADQTILAGAGMTVPISYSNIGVNQSALRLSFGSANTNLVPVENIKAVGNQLFVVPVGVQTGSAVITVTVTNPDNQSDSTSFKLTVVPGPTVFANSASINIRDNNSAVPYPSTINVSGVGSDIEYVTVSVKGLAHGFPQDISMLLVGPQGQSVVLMSRAGGSSPMTNTMVGFFDGTNSILPQFTLIADGTYRPTDYKISDSYFAPAPPPPYGKNLSVFHGTQANGTWSLYVQDDQQGDSGVITGGWVLNIVTTGPSISSPGPQTTPENQPLAVNFAVSSTTTAASNLVVTASSSGDSPAGIVSKLVVSGTGANRTLQITPGVNLPSAVTTANGTSTITLIVTDGTLTNSTSFPLTVTYVNQPPNITGLSDQITPANVIATMNFSVSDVDTPTSNIVVAATSADPSLGSIAVGGANAARTLTFTPAGPLGTTLVTVTANDGVNITTNTFAMSVTNGLPPVISSIPSITMPKALVPTSVSSSFTVVSGGTIPSTGLQVYTATDNTNLLGFLGLTVDGTNYTASAIVAPLVTGAGSITVYARDEFGLSTNGFLVTVTATNYPPTLGPIPDQTTKVNVNASIPLTVSDPDTAITSLVYTGTSTNSALVSGVSFAFNGTTEVATVNLVANKSGKDRVTISVFDGTTTVSQSFNLDVTGQSAAAPTLGVSVSNGQVNITVSGSPNTLYGFETTLDFKTWTDTGLTVTTDANGKATGSIPLPPTRYLFARAVAK